MPVLTGTAWNTVYELQKYIRDTITSYTVNLKYMLIYLLGGWTCALQWRHNERHGVSNHWRLIGLLNWLVGRRTKKTFKRRVSGLCEGNSPGTGEFPAQRASNADNASIYDVIKKRLLFKQDMQITQIVTIRVAA